MPSTDRCPNCDRDACATFNVRRELARIGAILPAGGWDEWQVLYGTLHAALRKEHVRLVDECECRPVVDWRGRALAAEAKLSACRPPMTAEAEDGDEGDESDEDIAHAERDRRIAENPLTDEDVRKRKQWTEEFRREHLASPPSLAPLRARAEALLAVADKATPGPWYGHDEEPRAIVSASNPDLSLLGIDVDGTAVVYRIEDARAIAALRDAPALIRDLLAALGSLPAKEMTDAAE